ncbi:MAG: uracil-DNA glycosylase [Dehalococcoidia bacterium]
MDAAEKAAALAELNEEIARCPDCELSRTRTHAVPGEGRPDADIVFIGEGPGYYEDQQARPFVGPAGQFLEQLLASIGLRREDVYIGNVIKCRPPENRDPLPQEINACRKWLDRQIEIISPRMVATLGRYSMNRYFPGQSISRIHGQPRRLGDVVVVPMYHPAAALHQGSLRRTIEEDFKKLPAILEQARKEEVEAAAPEPQQMRLL